MFQVFDPKMVTNVQHILPHLMQFLTFFNFKVQSQYVSDFFFWRRIYVSDLNQTLPNVNSISSNFQT